MRSLNSEDCLRIWEHTYAASPIGQALSILQVAHPESEYDALADLPVGERDRSLLLIRQATFGDHFEAYDECPQCSKGVEYAFTATELRSESPAPDVVPALELESHQQTIELSPLTTRDLLTINKQGEIDAMELLLQSNSLSANTKSWILTLEPEQREDIATAIEAHLEQIDPLSNISFVSNCPYCPHEWEAPFDIGSFLWKEVSIEAKRLLQEIHILASRYGWSEREILRLSKTRRHVYLSLGE